MTSYNKKVNHNLYSKLLGFLTKSGNRTKAKKILIDCFFYVCKKIKYNKYTPSFLLFLLFKKLNIYIELKTVQLKRRVHCIPFPISLDRRIFLISKWLILGAKKNKKKIPFSFKIAEEMLSVFLNAPTSNALKLRSLNNSQALAHRSNMHFRW